MTYVDDMRAKFGRMIMCHMTADTSKELLEMADRIGVARKWIQKAGTAKEHFDISLGKRALAIRFGAQEITWGQTIGKMREKLARPRPLLPVNAIVNDKGYPEWDLFHIPRQT